MLGEVLLGEHAAAHGDLPEPLPGLAALEEGVLDLGVGEQTRLDQEPAQRDAAVLHVLAQAFWDRVHLPTLVLVLVGSDPGRT